MALLAAAGLAGCADDPEGEGSSTTTSGVLITYTGSRTGTTSSSAGTTSSSTASGTTTGSSDNRAPTATLASTVDGKNATFSLSGSDPDGDVIVWDLEFGDGASANGTSLPATVTHAYAAGNFTAKLTVTDGTASATDDVAVAIAGAPAGFQPVVYSMAITTPCPYCTVISFETGVVPSAAFAAGEQGIDTIWLALTPEMVGKPFTVTSTGGDPDAVISAGCTPDATVIEAHGEGAEAGTIPAGAGCLVTWDFDTPESTITITVG